MKHRHRGAVGWTRSPRIALRWLLLGLGAGWAVGLLFSLAPRFAAVPRLLAEARLAPAERAARESGNPRWHEFLVALRGATAGRPGLILVQGGGGQEAFLTYRAAFELYPTPVRVLGIGDMPAPIPGVFTLDPETAAWAGLHRAEWVARWRDRGPEAPVLARITARSGPRLALGPRPWPPPTGDRVTPALWRWGAGWLLLCLVGGAAVRQAAAGPAPRWSAWDRAGVVMVVAGFGLAVAQALAPQSAWSTWDTWMNWDLKVKAIRYAGWLPVAFLTDRDYLFSHPEYPLGWPWLQAWLAACAGAFDTRLLRMLAPAFALALAPLLAALAGELGVTRGRWLVAGAVALLPLALDHAANGYVDWPMTTVTTGALVTMLRARRGAVRGLVAGGWAAAAGWMKQEGTVVGIACVTSLLWAARSDRARRRAAWEAAAAWVMVTAPLVAMRVWVHPRSDDFGPLTPALLGDVPRRMLMLAHAGVAEMLGSGRVPMTWGAHLGGAWLLFWYVALPVLAAGWRELMAPGRREVVAVLVAQAAAVIAAYVATNIDVAVVIGTTLDRMLLHAVPAVAALAGSTGLLAPCVRVAAGTPGPGRVESGDRRARARARPGV